MLMTIFPKTQSRREAKLGELNLVLSILGLMAENSCGNEQRKMSGARARKIYPPKGTAYTFANIQRPQSDVSEWGHKRSYGVPMGSPSRLSLLELTVARGYGPERSRI